MMTACERQSLLDAGAPVDSFDPDVQAAALASSRARAEATRHQASPELSVAEVAERLGCSPSTIRSWARRGDLYAVRRGRALIFPSGSYRVCGDSLVFASSWRSSRTRCTPTPSKGG